MDDVASGSYWYLSSLPDVLALVGAFPADDPDNANTPWVFVRTLATRVEAKSIVQGSSAVAIVVASAGQGSPALDYSTARWQRLAVDIWVDPLRDQFGNVTNLAETEGRGLNVFTVMDSHLHRASASDKGQLWGDLVTFNSIRLTEPTWSPVPDGDGMIRGVTFYDVGTYGNWDQNLQVGSGESGSGG